MPHLVHFYRDPRALGASVGQFISDGLAAGEAAVLVVTPAHRDHIRADLAGRGHALTALESHGDVVTLDARETLDAIQVRDSIVPARFEIALAGLTRQVCRGRTRPVRAYGELVDLLWNQGRADAALTLEELWNDLAADERMTLLCGYAAAHFYTQTDGAPMARLRREHSGTLPIALGDAPPLFWSRMGIVACHAHAPVLGSAAWRRHDWRPLPPGEGVRRRQCQFCHGGPLAAQQH